MVSSNFVCIRAHVHSTGSCITDFRWPANPCSCIICQAAKAFHHHISHYDFPPPSHPNISPSRPWWWRQSNYHRTNLFAFDYSTEPGIPRSTCISDGSFVSIPEVQRRPNTIQYTNNLPKCKCDAKTTTPNTLEEDCGPPIIWVTAWCKTGCILKIHHDHSDNQLK